MKNIQIIFIFLVLLQSCGGKGKLGTELGNTQEYALVLHGGAGTILKANMTEEKEQAYRKALNQALTIGEEILINGGSSIDAVEQTIRFMEDSPLFNAGKGSVFTHTGENEMDASIMFGGNQNAGAVGGVSYIKNPISAARAVMEHSEHVLLVGKGAETFAVNMGLDTIGPDYFFTENRWQSLQKVLQKEQKDLNESQVTQDKHGTVGVVALDKSGNISAGTSTGGMTNKRFNRIGDSPIIGAGTYADNATCGVSSTGHGEFFIRYVVAYAIHAQMLYGNKNLEDAANHIIHKVLVDKGGSGGVVSLDANGNIAMPFNTDGMYRAYAKPNERFIGIYKEDGSGKISD